MYSVAQKLVNHFLNLTLTDVVDVVTALYYSMAKMCHILAME